MTTSIRADRLRAAPLYRSEYVDLGGGAGTTIHVVRYPLVAVAASVVSFATATRLVDWCEANGEPEAVSGAFFWRPTERPLGEMWISGQRQATEPFRPPWHEVRGTLHIDAAGRLALGRRGDFPERPDGDLLQAGPLLVYEGRSSIKGDDIEGFSSAASQFDSDITDGPYPRSAIGVSESHLWSVAADGRGEHDAGLTIAELADYMVGLGVSEALNLDGGGSATLVSGGVMRNTSRNDATTINPRGRPLYSAVVFSAF